MPNYRRSQEGGATYFFTVVTCRRQPILTRPDVLEALREAFRTVQQTRPFKLDAIVILPDHLHAIWSLPPGDADFGARWAWSNAAYPPRSGILPRLLSRLP